MKFFGNNVILSTSFMVIGLGLVSTTYSLELGSNADQQVSPYSEGLQVAQSKSMEDLEGREDKPKTGGAVTPARRQQIKPAKPRRPRQKLSNCPQNAKAFRGQRVRVDCYCSPRAISSGGVWGSGIYTDDSKICRAALHARRVKPRGGNVRFIMRPGQRQYISTSRNGVRSKSYGSWHGSFSFN
jgi:hypothetical protein